jgi:type I restriction enzyme, S subunit
MSLSDWKEHSLGELIKHKKGFAFKSNDLVASGHPIIKVSNFTSDSIDIDGCSYVVDSESTKYIEYQIFHNDIIIATVGSWASNPNSIVGKVIRVPKKAHGAFLNQNSVILRVKDGTDQNFIFYKLKSKDFSDHLIAGARGSANQASVSLEDIFKFKFNLPNLEIQKKIATILSSLDDKIENNLNINQTLEEIARTLFNEMCLPKGDDLPEGWRVGKLSDLVTLNPKLQIKKGSVSIYIEMKDLNENSATIKNSREREFTSGSKFQNGDVLLARITPCLENGKTGLVSFLEENEIGWGSTEFIVLRGKEEAGRCFVYCLSRFEPFRNYAIKSMVGSSGRQRVVESILADYELAIPPEKILKEFEKTVNPFFNEIFANEQQNQTLKEIRDSLLPKLMSGEIEVNG